MLAIGLISGTSADGVDAALVEIGRAGGPPDRAGYWPPGELQVRTLAWQTTPYADALRAAVLRIGSGAATSAGEVCRVSFAVAAAMAAAAVRLCERAGVSPAAVEIAGSHGQTVWHEPVPLDPDIYAGGSTLQLGPPQVIAQLCGVQTVGDFRPRDLAAGGQGAPLVPVVDYLLFGRPDRSRILLNLGGIANITVLPAGVGPSQLLGYDTGPGNMLLDGAAAALSGGELRYDHDGLLAAAGRPDERLLAELLAEPYYAAPPPKSTGRELFGPAYLLRCLESAQRLGVEPAGLMATLTQLTAATVATAVNGQAARLAGRGPVELIASGGGVHNPALMAALRRSLAGTVDSLTTSDLHGVPSDAKEAVAFAVLAYLTLHGHPGNLPAATGATQPLVLGVLAPGPGTVR